MASFLLYFRCFKKIGKTQCKNKQFWVHQHPWCLEATGKHKGPSKIPKKAIKHKKKMSKLEAICNNQRRACSKKIYFHCLPWFLTAKKWAVFGIGLFFSNVAASIIDHISNFHQKRTIFLSIMYLSLVYICVENKHLNFNSTISQYIERILNKHFNKARPSKVVKYKIFRVL